MTRNQRDRQLRNLILIIFGVFFASFIAAAVVALVVTAGPSTPAQAAADPDMQGQVVSLDIYKKHDGKPSWTCPSSGTADCKKIVLTWPTRYEACVRHNRKTTCWYVGPAVLAKLREDRPIPSGISADNFTSPHSQPSAGGSTSYRVIATKPQKGAQ